ncbi:MAG: site-specific recombinase [Alphaproteobacteria bacterium]|nr:site-specific recombinase [Alphaproteobacteria bacterium]
MSRVPAEEVEAVVAKAVRSHLNPQAEVADAALITTHVTRVEIQSDRLIIQIADGQAATFKRKKKDRSEIEVLWQKPPPTRRREILVPQSAPVQDIRPIRSESRALLVTSIAHGRRWLNEMMIEPEANTESIAAREGCTPRQVNMTISLAFLAPDLVKAAIEGRLPHGLGVTRMRDLPAEWPRQRKMLGL